MKAKIPPINVVDQNLGKTTYYPFENELDLCCMARIERDNRIIGAFLLNKGDISDENKFQVVFAFHMNGIHDQLYKEEVVAMSEGISEAMKFLLPGEKCTFLLGRYSDDSERQQYLSSLVLNCPLKLPAILMRNEQAKLQELTRKGARQEWQQMVFCTWTSDEFGERKTDPLSSLIYNAGKTCRFFLDSVTGRLSERQEQVLQKVLMKAYTEGFLQWEMLFNTKAGLEISPIRETELWQWLWARFNSTEAPAIPQLLILREDKDTGVKVTEIQSSKRHATTILIQGERGRSSCPEHRQNTSRVYVKDKVCGVLTMADTVGAWTSVREQISWLWKVLSENHIRDTEVWVEISPANRYLTEDNLHRQAKQTKAARERALKKGTGRDVGAEIKQEESFDAQKKLYKGAVPLNCAVVFLVYRENAESLDTACELLAQSFGTAKVVRERNIASQIWLECLPITWQRILHSSAILSERRLVLESETVAGILPLTVPRELDKKGVEFLTMKGGKPVCVDLFTYTQHALVTGKTGSGKSVLLWRFMLDALSQGIPVVGMDIPAADGESSFKTGIELLGDAGAYFDLSRASNNLLEPPDLRHFDLNERTQRMKSWRSFIRNALGIIVMGRLNSPHLAQRADSILMQVLEIFLTDPDIIERYNLAFEKGWKSPEWQDMPTLKDFMRFCSIARLNIHKPEAIDHQAINQISSQIQALLVSPLGAAIGKPSSFSPEPIVKFYALTGLSNDQDSYTMAVAAKAACLRVALSYPKSLFIGDELSVLFRRDGFSAMVGDVSQITAQTAASSLSGSQVQTQIQGFINDVRSFVQGDLFGGITQLVENAIGSVKVPDLGQVVEGIMKGNLPSDSAISTQVENNLPNSYAIRQDAARMSERVGAREVAETQTLSKTAQDKSRAKLQSSTAAAEESERAAADSENTDTSQKILRNMSRQMKNQAAITNLQMQEASQARQDRALSLTLEAQAAEQLNEANVRSRQENIAAGNSASRQGGLFTMPGGSVLGNAQTR